MTKNLKALLARRAVPDMSQLADVSEFLTKSGYGSVSVGVGSGSKVHSVFGIPLGGCTAWRQYLIGHTVARSLPIPNPQLRSIPWQESEGEEAEQSRVVLPGEGAATAGAGAALAGRQSRVRLFEVGGWLPLWGWWQGREHAALPAAHLCG